MATILRKPITGLAIGVAATVVGVGLCMSFGAGLASAATIASFTSLSAVSS